MSPFGNTFIRYRDCDWGNDTPAIIHSSLIMPSAPLGISSQPRKRVKTFTRADIAKGVAENKENDDCSARGEEHQDDEDSEHDDSIAEPPFPQTPAIRIPLEDLIGNTEDAFNCPPPAATPADHEAFFGFGSV